MSNGRSILSVLVLLAGLSPPAHTMADGMSFAHASKVPSVIGAGYFARA